jgi:hypothetical protein
LTDHFERGKQLHPKIAAEILKIFQTMPPFTKQLNDARKVVDPQEAAYFQKIGNSPMRLIARELMRTGLAAASFVPTNSTREIDLKGFEAAIDEFFSTVVRYKEERASAKGSANDQVADMRVDFLVNAFRAVHDGYVRRKDVPQTTLCRFSVSMVSTASSRSTCWGSSNARDGLRPDRRPSLRSPCVRSLKSPCRI